MRTFLFFCSLLVVIGAGSAPDAKAWGERGHHTICEVATRLVQEPILKKYLHSRHHMMGHDCNIPDIYWRDLPPEDPLGDSAHFMNPEKAGLTIDTVPLSFAEYLDSLKTDDSSETRAKIAGSMWWRAEQFYRLGVKAVADHSAPNQFTDGIYAFMVNIGLMGHFVGDASQPYHNTVNYDGWANGHGGIHSFYESTCVDQLDFGFETVVFRKGLRVKTYEGSVVSVLKQLSMVSISELAEIEAADKVVEPSHDKVHAVRNAPQAACKAFTPLITSQLARASAQLAALWDRAFVEAGRPDLSKYHSYRYPLNPDRIAIDYIPVQKAEQSK